jgi:hypothetical protein
MPLTVAFTAQIRMAPTATSRRLTPIPMFSLLLSAQRAALSVSAGKNAKRRFLVTP